VQKVLCCDRLPYSPTHIERLISSRHLLLSLEQEIWDQQIGKPPFNIMLDLELEYLQPDC